MRKHLLLFSLSLFFSGLAFSQSSSSGKQAVHITKDTLQGTYEIIQQDTKHSEVFTTEILDRIEQARDDKEIVYLQLSSSTTVKIFPRSITNPGSATKQH